MKCELKLEYEAIKRWKYTALAIILGVTGAELCPYEPTVIQLICGLCISLIGLYLLNKLICSNPKLLEANLNFLKRFD